MQKKIFVVLLSGNTKISKILRVASKRQYTHVAIALDKQLIEVYSFGRRNLYLPLIGGFIQEDVRTGLYQRGVTQCAVYEIEITTKEYQSIIKYIEKFKRNCDNYGYNLLGLASMAIGVPLERKKHYFCSQFVAELLGGSGVITFDKNYALVRPYDFHDMQGHKKIFEGELNTYITYKSPNITHHNAG